MAIGVISSCKLQNLKKGIIDTRSGRKNQMNIQIMGPRFAYPETLSLFYDNAFKSLGFNTFGYCERTEQWWGNSTLKPDILLVIKGRGLNPDYPLKIRDQTKCNTVLYFPDPLEDGDNMQHIRAVRRGYQLLFLACNYPDYILERYKAQWLPVAMDPSIHRPLPAEIKKTRDVVFVGTYRQGRDWIMDVPGIEIFGNNWPPQAPHSFKFQDVYLDEKARIYQESKIIINHHYLNRGPNHRLFEGLAMGTSVLISDNCYGFADLGFVQNRDYVLYDQPHTVPGLIREYLLDDIRARKVMRSGAEAVIPHTYRSRVQVILRELGL